MEKTTFVEAIRNALRENLRDSSSTFIIGLGADYPNGADGTHQGHAASYPGRVFDTPMSESALTRLAVGAAVERGVDTNVTTQLDAGVSARNVEETSTVQGADPHVLDRFGLDGKIGSLGSTHGDETRR